MMILLVIMVIVMALLLPKDKTKVRKTRAAKKVNLRRKKIKSACCV